MSLFRCEKYLYLIHTKGFINTVNWGSARVFRLLCIINLNRKILTVTMNLRLKMMSWQFPNQPPSTTKKKSPGIALTHAVWLSMNWIMCNRDTRTAKGIWGKHLEIHLWLPQQSIPAAFPWCRHGENLGEFALQGAGCQRLGKGQKGRTERKEEAEGGWAPTDPTTVLGALRDMMWCKHLLCGATAASRSTSPEPSPLDLVKQIDEANGCSSSQADAVNVLTTTKRPMKDYRAPHGNRIKARNIFRIGTIASNHI